MTELLTARTHTYTNVHNTHTETMYFRWGVSSTCVDHERHDRPEPDTKFTQSLISGPSRIVKFSCVDLSLSVACNFLCDLHMLIHVCYRCSRVVCSSSYAISQPQTAFAFVPLNCTYLCPSGLSCRDSIKWFNVCRQYHRRIKGWTQYFKKKKNVRM